jgi:hypothetical protein
MLPDYKDIVTRVSESPKWWDAHGVPRYDDFRPELSSNIYANEVVLLRIACQCCSREFDVEKTWDKYSCDWTGRTRASLSEGLAFIHYGDPPNSGCCPAGATMNCIDLRVLQFWARAGSTWVRSPELEIELENLDEYFGDENDRI